MASLRSKLPACRRCGFPSALLLSYQGHCRFAMMALALTFKLDPVYPTLDVTFDPCSSNPAHFPSGLLRLPDLLSWAASCWKSDFQLRASSSLSSNWLSDPSRRRSQLPQPLPEVGMERSPQDAHAFTLTLRSPINPPVDPAKSGALCYLF